MTYDPAFMNTASCRSAITFIDGDKGILEYRGYPIEQLAEKSTYLEVAYLLIHGELPTQAELDEWTHQITIHTFVHENIKEFMQGFRYDAHPMGMLLASVGALSTFYPEAAAIKDPEFRYMQVIRLLAKMPTLAAFSYRHNRGMPYVYPDNDLSYAGQLPLDDLQDDRAEVPARSAARARARRALHPPRRPRAELLDQRGAQRRLLAGGPVLGGRRRRGGAVRAAPRRRQRGGAADAAPDRTKENIPGFIEGVKNGNEKLMGFGHRVYKNFDPRAKIIKKAPEDVFEVTGKNPLLDIATELEKIALEDEYFISASCTRTSTSTRA